MKTPVYLDYNATGPVLDAGASVIVTGHLTGRG